MAKKVLIVYYTQTGQLREIIDSIIEPLNKAGDIVLTFEELKPKIPFPFPWTSDEFFQAMPESVKGIPCELQPLSVTGKENFDLVIVAWQPWYLSPSIPTHAFFKHPIAGKILAGKPVVTVIGSRNMWVMAQKQIHGYITDAGGFPAGNILLYDKASNLLSVISIIRWMFKGKKERYLKFIPPAGVSEQDIKSASRFGECMLSAVNSGNYKDLRKQLIDAGAIDVQPGIVMIEKRGIIFFRIWADFILKKGAYGDKARLTRVRMFKYYLLTVLYLVSPFASILYVLIKPFRKKTIKKQISFYQSL
jgi:hypothetical protein